MKLFQAVFMASVLSLTTNAVEVCKIKWNGATGTSNPYATVSVVCTNPRDSKDILLEFKDVWGEQTRAFMKAETQAIKDLLQSGYKPLDAATYVK